PRSLQPAAWTITILATPDCWVRRFIAWPSASAFWFRGLSLRGSYCFGEDARLVWRHDEHYISSTRAYCYHQCYACSCCVPTRSGKLAAGACSDTCHPGAGLDRCCQCHGRRL